MASPVHSLLMERQLVVFGHVAPLIQTRRIDSTAMRAGWFQALTRPYGAAGKSDFTALAWYAL
jgi:hypothetical protein